MRSVYTGTLSDVTESGDDLPISIVLDDAWLDIISSDRSLGRWPLDQVRAERRLANRFTLTVAGEEWDFACDAPADFAIEGIEHIANYRPTRRPGWIERLRDQTGTLGRWALTSAIVVFGFGVGLVMGRYHLDGENLYTGGALAGLLALSLILTRITAHQPGADSAPPATDWRTQHHRSPLRVDQVIAPRSPAQRARRRDATPDEEAGKPPDHDRSFEPATPSLPAPTGSGPEAGLEPETTAHQEHGEGGPDEGPVPERIWEAAVETDGSAEPAASQATSQDEERREEEPREEELQGEEPQEEEPQEEELQGEEPQEEKPQEEEPEREEWVISIELDDLSEDDLDLATINGIGPVFAELLNDLGVDDVRSLALLDEDGIARIVEELGRFGKRLYTADWVGQARRRLGLSDVGEGSSAAQTSFRDGAAP